MAATFEVDYKDIEKLEQSISKIPDRAEKAINDVLHVEGVRIVTEKITDLIPVSNVHKNHAKDSKWSKGDTGNLEFTVLSRGGPSKNKNSYGYLVFPDEGRGRSNPVKQDFMKRGLESAKPLVVEKLHEGINKIIQEVL